MARISRKSFSDAVAGLAKLATIPCGGGKAAAQVLLSAEDGEHYQLNVVDLGSLDFTEYARAWVVMRGRTEESFRPSYSIDDGERIFARLEEQWRHLHVAVRGKK